MKSFLILIVFASGGVGGFAGAMAALLGISREEAVVAIAIGAAITFAVMAVCWLTIRRAYSAELP
jgi:uncharacterized membrane protein